MADESTAIRASSAGPATVESLGADLMRLGVASGSTLIVHSSLSRLGWVAGGAQAVAEALLQAIGPSGTLVMPAHTSHLTEPSRWQHPPIPEAWWPVVRDHLPAYDPATTPTRDMGAVVECFRTFPGTLRSAHPHASFVALGPLSIDIVGEHLPGCMFGDASPIGRLYELDAQVLLLGVGHGNNTSIHLGEYRADFPGKTFHEEGAPMRVDGERRWVTFRDLQVNDDDFEALGAAFAATGKERTGRVAQGDARLMNVRDIVDFATAWFPENRRPDEPA